MAAGKAIAPPPPGFVLENSSTPPPPPGFSLEEFRRQAPPSNSMLENVPGFLQEEAPAIGSIIGGVAGGLTAGPAGALAGTGLGTSIGTSAKQILERLQGINRPVTGEGGLVHEQLKNVIQQTSLEAGGQAVGLAGGAAAKSLFPAARQGAAEAQRALQTKGGTLSAAQATDSPTMNIIESFARAGAGGKGRFIALDANNAAALQAIKEDLIKNISAAPVNDRVAGKLFQDAITRGEAAHSAAANKLYAAFDQRAGGALVDALPVSQYGRALAADYQRIGNVGKTDAGGRLIDQLSAVPNTLTFGDAQLLRSNLLASIRDMKAGASPDTKAIATASGALRRLDAAMESSAQQLSPQLYGEYRNINKFYRMGKEAFNNDVVESLLRQSPERVGEELFKVGNVSEIIQAKASLRHAMLHDPNIDGKEAYARLQAGFLNAKLTARGATDKLGETTAQNLLKELADAKTNRQFAVMFTSDQRTAIADFANTAYQALNNRPQQFGVLMSMLQAGAIGTLGASAAGVDVGTKGTLGALGLLVGPWGLSKILTNPRAVTALANGLKLPYTTPIASPIVAKLTGEFVSAVNEGYDASKQ